jgi:nitrite reductase/ring-hydroxylating ferredoxin subunit
MLKFAQLPTLARLTGLFVLTFLLAGCPEVEPTSNAGAAGSFDSSVAASTTPSAAPITLAGVPPSSVTVGNSYAFQPTVSEGSGTITFSIQGQPPWVSFDASTGALSGTPSVSDEGLSADITISASNGSSTGSVGPFTILVNPESVAAVPPSEPPVISGAPATSVQSGHAYSFQPTASSASGKTLAFSIVNCPSWASFSTATGALTGTPSSAQAGTYSNIMISVSDGTTSVALAAFTITVQAPSTTAPTTSGTPATTAQAPFTTAPTISGTPASTVVAGQAYTFQPTAAGAAGATLTFSISNKPAWASFNTVTGALIGTPSSAQAGTYSNITISVSNGTTSVALAAFTITVQGPQVAPTISGTPATTVVAGQAYTFQPTATGAAGAMLSFSSSNKPAWANFNIATGALTGTPSSAQVGTYSNISISVSDGTNSAALPAFAITVTPTVTGFATLQWAAPTQNTNGSALTNLAGYVIYWGTSTSALTQSITVTSASTTSYVVSGLTSGTWYFAVQAYDSLGNNSTLSNIGSKTI